MSQKLILDDYEFDIDNLSKDAAHNLRIMQICKNKIQELEHMLKFLSKARSTYISELAADQAATDFSFQFGQD